MGENKIWFTEGEKEILKRSLGAYSNVPTLNVFLRRDPRNLLGCSRPWNSGA